MLLCTPALREVKRLNPRGRIILYTKLGMLVEGLPFIDEVRPVAEAKPAEVKALEYEGVLAPRRHLASVIGDTLGVTVRDVRPSCVVRHELVTAFEQQWSHLPRPWVVVSRRAGPWTPNKNWPDESWAALLADLKEWATVFETGAEPADSPVGDGVVDLRSRLSLDQLVAVIAAADLHIGPDSGPIHVAAAVGTPAVVIVGGYISEECIAYPGNIHFSNALPCAPCWLREPCPIDRECLRKIAPEAVAQAVRDRLAEPVHASAGA